MTATLSMSTLPEPMVFWGEAYVMQPGNGRRRAVSTTVQMLERVTCAETFWQQLAERTDQTANLCSLHVFREGIAPQYDDPKNANGGHFKTKPIDEEAAVNSLHWMAQALVDGTFPNPEAVHGITIAKKARSSLVKLWIADSLDQPVIDALNKWFDDHVGDLCGRRLFSPHKYILNTYSQQRRQGVPAGGHLAGPPAPLWHPTGPPPMVSVWTPYGPVVASPTWPPGFYASPVPMSPYPVMCSPAWPEGMIPGSPYTPIAPVSPYTPGLLPQEQWPSGPAPPATTPDGSLSSCGSSASSYLPYSLHNLMNCSRSDPDWRGVATSGAMTSRLEATVRKCEALRLSRSGQFTPSSSRGSFSDAADSVDGDVFG